VWQPVSNSLPYKIAILISAKKVFSAQALGVNVVKLLSSSLTAGHNKLESLSVESFL